MAYATPDGMRRVWSYLPDALLEALQHLAVSHRRSLPQEFRVAVEAYVATQHPSPSPDATVSRCSVHRTDR